MGRLAPNFSLQAEFPLIWALELQQSCAKAQITQIFGCRQVYANSSEVFTLEAECRKRARMKLNCESNQAVS